MSILGRSEHARELRDILEPLFGNASQLWMWDFPSLENELKNVGFTEIRACQSGDAKDPMFLKVENLGRFIDAVAIEAIK